MPFWLFKEEPSHYSFADLERDGSAAWDGIANALALKHLRQCRSGDQVLFYHSGKEKAVVGVMTVAAGHQTETAVDKDVTVTVRPKKRLKNPVTLARIKADPAFAGWELVKFSRLSVMPVPPALWERILLLGEQGD